MTRLLIIRHGNTFGPDETPTRVGGLTDLSLVESGIEQARALGQHFKNKGYIPDAVFASELMRTQQTATEILTQLSIDREIKTLSMLNEINYGPDENKVEDEVVARIGQEAIDLWDKEAIVPQGWEFDPDKAIQDWQLFSQNLIDHHRNETVMVVTSNGVGRFAPYLTSDYEGFKQQYKIKLKTGAYGSFLYNGGGWEVEEWGVRP